VGPDVVSVLFMNLLSRLRLFWLYPHKHEVVGIIHSASLSAFIPPRCPPCDTHNTQHTHTIHSMPLARTPLTLTTLRSEASRASFWDWQSTCCWAVAAGSSMNGARASMDTGAGWVAS
jgi:hypothetical protein